MDLRWSLNPITSVLIRRGKGKEMQRKNTTWLWRQRLELCYHRPRNSWLLTPSHRAACLFQSSQAASYCHTTDHTAPLPGHLLPISWALPLLNPSPAILQDLFYVTSAGGLRIIRRHLWGPCTYHVV